MKACRFDVHLSAFINAAFIVAASLPACRAPLLTSIIVSSRDDDWPLAA
jgi:hypothetical protein